MELTEKSIILYQRCYDKETNQDISPSDIAYQVKNDTLILVTLLFNRLDGLYVQITYKDYEFYEELHWIHPSNNFDLSLYPTLENIEGELTRTVEKYIGINLSFQNVRGTMIFNLLLSQDLTHMQ